MTWWDTLGHLLSAVFSRLDMRYVRGWREALRLLSSCATGGFCGGDQLDESWGQNKGRKWSVATANEHLGLCLMSREGIILKWFLVAAPTEKLEKLKHFYVVMFSSWNLLLKLKVNLLALELQTKPLSLQQKNVSSWQLFAGLINS